LTTDGQPRFDRQILRKVGAEAVISRDVAVIETATKLILPGVGAFDEGMKNIHALGLRDVLTRRALHDHVPTLGICLGMQLMARGSEEGSSDGLAWLDGDVKRFRFTAADPALRVPHMGWNTVKRRSKSASTLFGTAALTSFTVPCG
jgi:glutamine amidotransferase